MKRSFFFISAFLSVLLMISGCATRVPMVVTKPAQVDMSGIRRISILEFEYTGDMQTGSIDKLLDDVLDQFFTDDGSALTAEEKIALYATNRVSQTLGDTQYFTIVDPGDFKESLSGMTDRIQFFEVLNSVYDVEAVFLGSITVLRTTETYETRVVVKVDEETEEEVEVEEEWVTRKAELEMEYRIIDTMSSELIVQKVFNQSRTNSKPVEDYQMLTAEEQMYRSMIDSIVQTISRQLVPYKVTVNRKLLKDKEKDPRMEIADEYVKVAKYENALETYLTVWDESRNIAAGFNAAIMYEALGNIDAAIETMNMVLNTYPDKDVFRALERLKATKAEQEKARQQMEGRT